MSQEFNYARFFTKFPELNLGKWRLRDITLSDAEGYYNILSHPEVSRYFSDEDIPTSIESAVSEIKFWGSLFYRKQSIFWAIEDLNTKKLIGTIGFNQWNIKNRRAEINYDLAYEYWGQGIMTNILGNVLSFSFNKMNINRIEARTMVDNVRSQKLLEKVNFQYEGCIREYRIVRGSPIDVLVYSTLRKDNPLILGG